MEYRLFEQSFSSILNHDVAKFATPSHFRSKPSCQVMRKSFDSTVYPSLRIFSSPTSIRCSKRDGTDEYERQRLRLDKIRESLIRQEDSIIFTLLERAQYFHNAKTYDEIDFLFMNYNGSSTLEFLLRETEKLHHMVGRYRNSDENAFYPKYLSEESQPTQFPEVLHPCAKLININLKIWHVYFTDFLPKLVKRGDDGNYGSTAACDINCLQVMSKRIHYGKYVAEAKFQQSPAAYIEAIAAQDKSGLMQMLTHEAVEAEVIKRVEAKAKAYSQFIYPTDAEVDQNNPAMKHESKFNPSLAAYLYSNWIIPLTKEVEVQYLLQRLE